MSGSSTVRWMVRILGVALAVVLAALLVLRIYGSRRLAAAERVFAAKVGPMSGNPYASARVPEDKNAAIYLRAGAEAIVMGKERVQAGEMTMSPTAAWTVEQRELMSGLLTRNGPALELLHRAAGMTESSFGLVDPANETEELKTKLPLLKLISAQRLLFLDARMALLEGNRERFLADAGSMSTMAVALERESPMVAMLLGIAAEKILLAASSEAAARPDVSVEILKRLQGLLLRTELRAVWRRALVADAVAIDRRVAALEVAPQRAAQPGFGLKNGILDLCFGDVFKAQGRELYSDLLDVVDQPLGSNPRWADRGKARPKSMFSVFESVMFSVRASSGGRVQSTMSLRNLANVALKVRMQGLQTGAYPKTLASFPEVLRQDPFAD